MKIVATCSSCQRNLLLSQLAEDPQITGRCPWCGFLLAPQYTALLVDTIRRAEAAGSELTGALELLRALQRPDGDQARFRVRPESVLIPIQMGLTADETTERPRLPQAA
jgi:hypothetical protein